MKELLLSLFVVQPLYLMMVVSRYFFLRFKLAQQAHNFLFYALGKIFTTQPEHKRKFIILLKGMRGQYRVVEWQKIIYQSHPSCWKHFFKNVFVRRLIVGSVKRRWLARKGCVVPSTISLSLNMPGAGCNLSCKHCYAKGHSDSQMPPSLLKAIIKEGEQLGINNIFLLGGEPWLYPGIKNYFKEFPKTTFWLSTNGTLLEAEEIHSLAELGNVIPIISLEGFQKETDVMRGEGVFAKAINAMKTCGQAKILYLASVTVHRGNFHIVTSSEFMEMLVGLRCIGVNYSCYVPAGAEAMTDWQITDQQSERLDQWGRQIMKKYPIFSTVGRNGTGRVSDCYAARQYIHILPDGQAEPCPFVPYAPAVKIQDKGILGITASEFFQGVRYLNGLGVPGLTPCRSNDLIDSYFKKLGAKKTITI